MGGGTRIKHQLNLPWLPNIFQKYAERQTSKPMIRDGMELVPQPDDATSFCRCHRKMPGREEL